MFIGIGFLTVPASLVVAALQSLILGTPEVAGVSEGGEGGGFRVILAALVSFFVLGTSILLVLAATTHALGEIDRDAEVDVRRAYRLALARWRPLLGAFLIASALVALLTVTVVLSPVAVAAIVLFALFVPVIAFEGPSARRLAPSQRRTGPAPDPQDRRPPGHLDPAGRRRRADPRHDPHPGHRRTLPAGQHRRRGHLRRPDAVRRAHHGVPLLRRPHPVRAGPRRRRPPDILPAEIPAPVSSAGADPLTIRATESRPENAL